jgi:geranylgeranyl diphosphate synthase type I
VDIVKFLEETAPLIDKAIEKYIPREFSENSVLFKVNPPLYSGNLEALNKGIAEPIWEILDRGGK